MSGLPASLTARCLQVLDQCSEFDDAETLSALLTVSRELHDFASQLPKASNKRDQILVTLDFLLTKKFPDSRPVAPFFLRTLAQHQGTSDQLRADLLDLAQQVEAALGEHPVANGGVRRDVPRYAPSRPMFVVGRSRELQEIVDTITNNRSVGIFGMVGVGKETVAKEAFHQLKELFREHGYSCVEVPNASIEEIREVIQRDYCIGVARPDYNELRALIFLNAVVPDQESLRQLLSLMPNAALIVTSTQTWPLDDLYTIQLDPLQPEDAVEMFCRVCGPRIALTPHHKKEVLPKICDSIGCLPLAIQIVANRVRVTGRLERSLVESLESEKQRLDALRCGNESVEASFNVSFAKLSDSDKYLFACLGVFAGNTFSDEAVGAIVPTSDANDRLFHLKMLFLVDSKNEGRYGLHPLLKSFAKRKLDKLPDVNEIKERCARYFFNYTLANRHPLDRLDRDAQTILDCLAWCEKEMSCRNQADLVGYLAGFVSTTRARAAWLIYLLARLYKRRKELAKAREYYGQALAVAEAENQAALKGACSRSIGEMCLMDPSMEAEGFQWIYRGMAALEQAGDAASQKELVFTLTMLANYYREKDDKDAAMAHAVKALAARDRIPESLRKDHREGLSYSARIVIETYVERDNCPAAYETLEREWRQLDSERDLGPVLGHVGRLLCDHDDFDKARRLFDQASQVYDSADNPGGSAWICRCRGDMYLRQGHRTRALKEYQEAVNYRCVAGERMRTAAAVIDLARMYHLVGDRVNEDACWRDFSISYEQESLSSQTRDRYLVSEALALYGEALLCNNCPKMTPTNLMLASGLYSMDATKGEPAHIHHLRGDHYFCRGNVELAEAEYEQAVATRKDADEPEKLTRTLRAIGDTFLAAGKKDVAEKWYRQIDERARARN